MINVFKILRVYGEHENLFICIYKPKKYKVNFFVCLSWIR